MYDNPSARKTEAPSKEASSEDDCKYINLIVHMLPSLHLFIVVSHLSAQERKKAKSKQRKAMAKAQAKKADQEKEKGKSCD